MDASEISDAGLWDGFVSRQAESQFLQSWSWGEFQQAVGRTVYRLGVTHHNTLIAAAQCILQEHGFGIRSFSLYRGPILDTHLDIETSTQALESLLILMEACGREHGAAYLHMEPPFVRTVPAATLLADRPGWLSAPSNQPGTTQLLALAPPLDELLSVMHEKTRYNIRLAERKDVRIETTTDPKHVEHFLTLIHTTSRRDGIHVHPDPYYRTMAEVLCPKGLMTITLAHFANITIAANLLYHFGDTVTYGHGASADEHRNVMAPHLLQWEQIKSAKLSGARWYDFWGVAPASAEASAGKPHPWAGITRFKKGFGGERRTYLTPMEKSIRSLAYRLVRLRRGLR